MPDIANVIITGASGGLGRALATCLARPGRRLSLWGRDKTRLEATAGQCRAQGAKVHTRLIDFCDLASALDALMIDDNRQPFEMMILAAGQGDIRPEGALVETAELVARLGQINFLAPTTLAAEMAGRMASRGRGRIVIIGSAAGFHALPFAAAYAGTKAGLARFADALRLGVKEYGVTVTLVSPGFIDTEAAHRVPGPKPFMMSARHAAECIIAAAERRQTHLVLPQWFALLHLVDRLLPAPLRDRLLLSLAPPRV